MITLLGRLAFLRFVLIAISSLLYSSEISQAAQVADSNDFIDSCLKEIEENDSKIKKLKNESASLNAQLLNDANRYRYLMYYITKLIDNSEATRRRFEREKQAKDAQLYFQESRFTQESLDWWMGQPDVFYYERNALEERIRPLLGSANEAVRAFGEVLKDYEAHRYSIKQSQLQRLGMLHRLSVGYLRLGDYSKSILISQEAQRLRDALIGRPRKRCSDIDLVLALAANALGDKLGEVELIFNNYLSCRKDLEAYKRIAILTELLILMKQSSSYAGESYSQKRADIKKVIVGHIKNIDIKSDNILKKNKWKNENDIELDLILKLKAVDGIELLDNMGLVRSMSEDNLSAINKLYGDSHPEISITLSRLSCIEAREGNILQAFTLQEQSSHILLNYLKRALPMLSDSDQSAFLSREFRRVYHYALSLGFMRRAIPAEASVSADWVLNGKGVIHEALATVAQAGHVGNDEGRDKIIKEYHDVQSQVANLTYATPRLNSLSNHKDDLLQLLRKAQELKQQVGKIIDQEARSDSWVNVEDIRKAIPKNSILIELLRFNLQDEKELSVEIEGKSQHYVAWIIPSHEDGRVQVIDLGDAQVIDEAIYAYRRSVEPPNRAVGTGELKPDYEAAPYMLYDAVALRQNRRSAAHLASLVLKPIVEVIPEAKKEWIISPDSLLWLVPWAALPLCDPAHAKRPEEIETFVVEKKKIRYMVSGRHLVSFKPITESNPPVVIADPDYDHELMPLLREAKTTIRRGNQSPAPKLRPPGGFSSSLSFSPVLSLPETAIEAQRLIPGLAKFAGIPPGDVRLLTREKATEHAFMNYQSPKVLVFITHGFYLQNSSGTPGANQTPFLTARSGSYPLLRGGLLLAGCNRRLNAFHAGADDGVLSGLEITAANLRNTDLVVLSACETGVGQVGDGEGVAGLRQAFQLAGARTVVATLWKVRDKESVRLMPNFFSNLASGGMDKTESLRQAQITEISWLRTKFKAAPPFFWAAYTVTGQGK